MNTILFAISLGAFAWLCWDVFHTTSLQLICLACGVIPAIIIQFALLILPVLSDYTVIAETIAMTMALLGGIAALVVITIQARRSRARRAR